MFMNIEIKSYIRFKIWKVLQVLKDIESNLELSYY